MNDTRCVLHVNLITVLGFPRTDYGEAACVFCVKKGENFMPRNQFQRMIFALLTVIITVHAYVFYSLYVVNGNILMELNNAQSVLSAINA